MVRWITGKSSLLKLFLFFYVGFIHIEFLQKTKVLYFLILSLFHPWIIHLSFKALKTLNQDKLHSAQSRITYKNNHSHPRIHSENI